MKIIQKIFQIYFITKTKKYKKKDLDSLHIKENDTFLVISNTALGDTLLSTPAIKSLKRSFPQCKIVALIHKNYIPLFENFNYIDKIIPFMGGYKHFFPTIKKIRKLKPKIALIFHGNGPQDIQISVLSGCQYILKTPNNSELKSFLSFDFKKKKQHTIEDRLDLVRKIGGKKIDTTMEIPPLDNKIFLEKYSKFKKYIGFQIGAADTYRMWPIKNFIELAKKIDTQIVLTGIEKEWKSAQKICDEVGNQKVINLCGKSPIEELPYLINNLKLLITNDTGTMHLAIALKTPTISIFPPISLPEGIGAYQDKKIHKIIQNTKNVDIVKLQNTKKKERDSKAMELVSVDEVYNAYLESTK